MMEKIQQGLNVVSKFAVVLFLFASIAMEAAIGAGGPCTRPDNVAKDDGECWNSLSGPQKSAVIRGIWVGIEINKNSLKVRGEDPYSFMYVDYSSLPGKTNIGDIISYFDELYGYAVNRNITWENAYVLASLRHRDDDSNDRLSLLRFFRDNNSLPTSGTWDGNFDDGRIKIVSNGKNYTIRLAGVDVRGVDAAINERIKNISTVLGGMNFFEFCSTEPTADIDIGYPYDLFDENRNLNAVVTINGAYVCIKDKVYSLSSAFGGSYSSKVVLNTFLVSKGLSKFDNGSDPLWSEERTNAKGIWDIVSQQSNAEKIGLYIHGGSEDKYIEKINKIMLGLEDH